MQVYLVMNKTQDSVENIKNGKSLPFKERYKLYYRWEEARAKAKEIVGEDLEQSYFFPKNTPEFVEGMCLTYSADKRVEIMMLYLKVN